MLVMEEAVHVEGRAYVGKHCCDLKLLQKTKSILKTPRNYVSKSGIKCHIKASSSKTISGC